MQDTQTVIEQAKLILHLFELRRESVMRAARSYIGGEFLPRSAEEFVSLVVAGSQQSGYILQVFGYWDMVAGFVVHGALTEPLVYDTCQEMYFQYAKIQPWLAGFRQQMHLPEFLRSIEAVVEGSPQGQKRLADMRANIERIIESRSRKE